DDVDPVGTLLRGTLLIEECALDAVRIAYEHVRASPCGVQRAVGDGQVVAHDVELRMPGRGKQHLARVRHGHLAACRYDQLRLGRSRHRGAPSDAVSPSASSRVPDLDREPYREAALAACVLERCPSDASRTRATSACHAFKQAFLFSVAIAFGYVPENVPPCVPEYRDVRDIRFTSDESSR